MFTNEFYCYEPKIASLALRTQLWGAIATHRKKLLRETLSQTIQHLYFDCYEENVFCFLSYGIQYLATFLTLQLMAYLL